MEIAALWISFVAAAAGLASAVIAWTARADAIKSGERAQKSADRATAAAERMAHIQSQIFEGPPWAIEYLSGESYLLTNTSPVAARNVRVTSIPETLGIDLDRDVPFDIGPRSAIKFMYDARLVDPWARDIVVTWTREGDDVERVWTHPIPPKNQG